MTASGPLHTWPQRLHHTLPGWVGDGETFHVRLRMERPGEIYAVDPALAGALISAAENYHRLHRWHCELFLVMPDHVHALLAFFPGKPMSKVVGTWKRYLARTRNVKWQVNYFDHRIRSEKELHKTWHYILRNPVVKGLCASEDDWPWRWWPNA